jgi:hypothetical protein
MPATSAAADVNISGATNTNDIAASYPAARRPTHMWRYEDSNNYHNPAPNSGVFANVHRRFGNGTN